MKLLEKSFGKLMVSATGGFTMSLSIFAIMQRVIISPTLGNIFTQGPSATLSQYPNASAALYYSFAGANPMLISFSSYLWWSGVMIGGLVGSKFLHRVLCRYHAVMQTEYLLGSNPLYQQLTGYQESEYVLKQKEAMTPEEYKYV